MISYEDLYKSNEPFFKEYLKAFINIFDSGRFILGEKEKEFENAFADYCGASHCIGVANGLDALTLSLKVLEFPEGSEVIVPSNTYIATILAIMHNNLVPVLVEPDITTYNLDPSKIEEHITDKTRAILPVHLYGKMCDMHTITEIASKHRLAIIEDCAQAHGARFKNKFAGNWGHINAFSFYPTKNLGALGDGGAITTNYFELASAMGRIRNYGSAVKYYNDVPGYNSRLDELQAALLLVKLKHLRDINDHKRDLAHIYLNNLKSDFIKPVIHPDYYDVFHIFAIRHPKRDELKQYLLKNGIGTEIHYPVPPAKQKALKGFKFNSMPIADEIHNTILSLPLSCGHNVDDIFKVIEVMNKF